MEPETQGIRWGRALLAAVIVELLLGVLAVPFAFSDDAGATLNTIVPPASFVVTLLVVLWLFRRAGQPVANGVATGFISLGLYVVLSLAAYLVAPDQTDFSQALGVPYIASHLLKILGGAAGGWLIARRRPAAG